MYIRSPAAVVKMTEDSNDWNWQHTECNQTDTTACCIELLIALHVLHVYISVKALMGTTTSTTVIASIICMPAMVSEACTDVSLYVWVCLST